MLEKGTLQASSNSDSKNTIMWDASICLIVGRNPNREAENIALRYIKIACWIDTCRRALWFHCWARRERTRCTHVSHIWLIMSTNFSFLFVCSHYTAYSILTVKCCFPIFRLVCTALYSDGDGERKYLPQFFKFIVANPLSVRTKVPWYPSWSNKFGHASCILMWISLTTHNDARGMVASCPVALTYFIHVFVTIITCCFYLDNGFFSCVQVRFVQVGWHWLNLMCNSIVTG